MIQAGRKLVTVATSSALREASDDPSVQSIAVVGSLDYDETLVLRASQHLVGDGPDPTLRFRAGVDGVRVSTDNLIQGLRIETAPDRRAVFAGADMVSLGTLTLRDLRTIGQVQILFEGVVRSGHIVADGVDVIDADTTDREYAFGYGVIDFCQGAFTLWNRQPDVEVVATADLRGIRIGRQHVPVRGSGVFLAGAADSQGDISALYRGSGSMNPEGELHVTRLETSSIYCRGTVPESDADRMAGGVIVLYGTTVDIVDNHGPVLTNGHNTAAVCNVGRVGRWTVEGALVSQGSSSHGFANVGSLDQLEVRGPIETFGTASRGFTVYLGVVKRAEFDDITTHGDAAIGVEIDDELEELIIHGRVHTSGGRGPSLQRGGRTDLAASALRIGPGGQLASADCGELSTKGDDIFTLDVSGLLGHLVVRDKLTASGHGSSPALQDLETLNVEIA